VSPVTCPSCNEIAEPAERGSDWCAACVHSTLREQARLRHEPVKHQVFRGRPKITAREIQ